MLKDSKFILITLTAGFVTSTNINKKPFDLKYLSI